MTSDITRPVLMVFVDGVGLAKASSSNPLSHLDLPHLAALVGGPLTLETIEGKGPRAGVHFAGIDACLGVEGLPQSATGQTALFTGHNAAELLGRHVPALPGARLRELIEQHSVFKVLASRGSRCAFANAFTDRFFEYLEQPRARRRPSASLSASLAGGVRLRTERDLVRGEAVAWDITREYFGVSLPELRLRAQPSRALSVEPACGTISAVAAGRHLHRLAMQHHFTLFETFLTDLAGHGRYVVDAETALGRVDGLMGGLAAAIGERGSGEPGLTIVLTSDHGNVEDLSTALHTRNTVPLIAWGPGATAFEAVQSLIDVVPAMLLWQLGKA